MSKKLIAIFLVALMALSALAFTGCDKKADVSGIKIGFICLHDENSTYDKNFIDAVAVVKEELGLTDDQIIIKTNIPETNDCYDAACELVADGCNIVFANSFGHEDFILQAAKEYPDVQFCHATGTKAHTENVANFHNAFAAIYEGRFLAGVVAGLKLNEMIESGKITAEQAKMGYIGAMTYAEVKSGYTSFYLGAKYVCPSVTMDVVYTGSWYDEAAEREAALNLINNNCVLISQHADSWGAPTACEEKGVPNVSYNGSTISACGNTALISSKINWAPYYKLIIESVANGEAIPADWCGTIATGSVELTELNTNVAAEGTQAKLDEIKEKLIKGEIKVFDTATFTVNGAALTTYKADVDTDANWTPDTEVIADGAFNESKFRSAPYFDIIIDGINAAE